MIKRKSMIGTLALVSALCVVLYLLYYFNYIPHRSYTNADFGIENYYSPVDADSDGIDDQSDILASVREYISTKPEYKSKYYDAGYPDDRYGVCTDVVARGLLGAGYDLMELVNADISANPDMYEIDNPDKNIDFRRVRSLAVYFKNTAVSLSTDTDAISEWQGGDIVIFKKHIAVVSDKRNKRGVPFIIHHANSYQASYEEDELERHDDIIGHYRIS